MLRSKTALTKCSHLGFESLETRSLLSALHASAATHVDSAVHHAAQVGRHDTAEVAKTLHSKSHASDNHGDQNETRLVATLAPPAGAASAASGTAKLTSETEHGSVTTKLVTKVKDAPPGTTLDVSIDGVKAGQIAVSQSGTGQLSLKTTVPAVKAGSTVSLTDSSTNVEVLNGTLTAPTATSGSSHVDKGPDATDHATAAVHSTAAIHATDTIHSNAVDHSKVDDHSHGSDSAASETHLGASFVDPANASFTGSVRYDSDIEHGIVVSELSVGVKGLTPGTKIDVTIADATVTTTSSVGQITVGANGKGKLELVSHPYENSQQAFPSDFPGLSAGSKVTLTLNNAGSTSTISAVLGVPASSKDR